MKDLGGRGAHPRAVPPARQTADLPPGYPQEFRRLVTLHDGRSVLIRPVLPSDAPAPAKSIASADADTIHRRFLGGHPHVKYYLIDFFTTVFYTSRFALVAVEPASQRGVAIARYEPAEQDGAADVAIAVIPGWRGAGLASELLHVLAQAASERGIHTFTRHVPRRQKPGRGPDQRGGRAREPGHLARRHRVLPAASALGSRTLGHDHAGLARC